MYTTYLEKLAESKAGLIAKATEHIARHPKAYVGGSLAAGGALGLGGGYLLSKRRARKNALNKLAMFGYDTPSAWGNAAAENEAFTRSVSGTAAPYAKDLKAAQKKVIENDLRVAQNKMRNSTLGRIKAQAAAKRQAQSNAGRVYNNLKNFSQSTKDGATKTNDMIAAMSKERGVAGTVGKNITKAEKELIQRGGAPKVGRLKALGKWMSKNRGKSALIGGGLLAAGAGGTYLLKHRNNELQKAAEAAYIGGNDMNSYVEAELLAKEAEDAYSIGDYETAAILEDAAYEKIAEGEALEYAIAADEAYELGDVESGQILEQAAYEKLAEGKAGAVKELGTKVLNHLRANKAAYLAGLGGLGVGAGATYGIGRYRRKRAKTAEELITESELLKAKIAEDEALEYANAADEAYALGDYESGQILEQAAYEKLAEASGKTQLKRVAGLNAAIGGVAGGIIGALAGARKGPLNALGTGLAGAALGAGALGAAGAASFPAQKAYQDAIRSDRKWIGKGLIPKEDKVAEDLDAQDVLLQSLLG